MAKAIQVQTRQSHGKRASRRLRTEGNTPGILYGHGEACVSLTVPSLDIATAVRRGMRVIELKGAVNEKAFIRDLQWDVYGVDILHVDFTRVSEHERIELRVTVELRGQAPGVKEGGVVELLVHDLEIECEALNIPEKIGVSINELNLHGSISAGEIKLPDGVKLISDPETLVVHCIVPLSQEEPLPGEAAAGEPEVIGRKPEEGAAEEA